MKSFQNYLKSYDGYGEPIQVSYKGSPTYQTGIGAILTLSLQAFMLAYLVTESLALLNFNSNQVTQYKKYDQRNEGTELNLDENNAMYGEFLFGFLSSARSGFNPPDPRICTFQLQSVSFKAGVGVQVLKDIPF